MKTTKKWMGNYMCILYITFISPGKLVNMLTDAWHSYNPSLYPSAILVEITSW